MLQLLEPQPQPQPWVELCWTVTGDRVPSDHNYRLYSALIDAQPQLKDLPWQLGTITGIPDRHGWIQLGNQSTVRIRCEQSTLPLFLALNQQVLRVGKALVQLGTLTGGTLSPAPNLRSRMVTIKLDPNQRVEAFDFGVALGQQLARLGITTAPRLGDRKCLRIRSMAIVGFELAFHDLPEPESMILQTHGIGGRRRMGCGFFERF